MPLRLDSKTTLSQAIHALREEPFHEGDHAIAKDGQLTLQPSVFALTSSQRAKTKTELTRLMCNELGPDGDTERGRQLVASAIEFTLLSRKPETWGMLAPVTLKGLELVAQQLGTAKTRFAAMDAAPADGPQPMPVPADVVAKMPLNPKALRTGQDRCNALIEHLLINGECNPDEARACARLMRAHPACAQVAATTLTNFVMDDRSEYERVGVHVTLAACLLPQTVLRSMRLPRAKADLIASALPPRSAGLPAVDMKTVDARGSYDRAQSRQFTFELLAKCQINPEQAFAALVAGSTDPAIPGQADERTAASPCNAAVMRFAAELEGEATQHPQEHVMRRVDYRIQNFVSVYAALLPGVRYGGNMDEEGASTIMKRDRRAAAVAVATVEALLDVRASGKYSASLGDHMPYQRLAQLLTCIPHTAWEHSFITPADYAHLAWWYSKEARASQGREAALASIVQTIAAVVKGPDFGCDVQAALATLRRNAERFEKFLDSDLAGDPELFGVDRAVLVMLHEQAESPDEETVAPHAVQPAQNPAPSEESPEAVTLHVQPSDLAADLAADQSNPDRPRTKAIHESKTVITQGPAFWPETKPAHGPVPVRTKWESDHHFAGDAKWRSRRQRDEMTGRAGKSANHQAAIEALRARRKGLASGPGFGPGQDVPRTS